MRCVLTQDPGPDQMQIEVVDDGSPAVDVAALDRAAIEGYVGSLSGENYFYDAETHRRLFSLPLYLRRELGKGGDVF